MRLLPLLILPTLALACPHGKTCIEIHNNCPHTIWPGIQGSAVPDNGGFRLNSTHSHTIHVPDGWKGGIWARTGCDANMSCDTGSCGHQEGCRGRSGEPPASLAEFALNEDGGKDYYHVSLIDGYNLPVIIQPKQDTFVSYGGDCERVAQCYTDLLHACPHELRKTVNGRTVACKSACLVFQTAEYCCFGEYHSQLACRRRPWGKNYFVIFKNACPTALSYA